MLRKNLDYFFNLFLAPDNDGSAGGDPEQSGVEGNENQSSTEIEGSTTEGNQTNEPKNEIDLDYSKFDLNLNPQFDPSNLSSKAFADKAKELGISVDKAKDLFGVFDSSIKQSKEDFDKTANERCKTALKERWKDNYETRNKAVTRGFLKLTEGDESLNKELNDTGLMNNPLFVEIVSRVGGFFKEEVQGGGGSPAFDESDPYGFAKEN